MKQTRRTFLGTAALAPLGATLPKAAFAQEALSLALVTPSPTADVGWSHELVAGSEAAAEAVGGELQLLENIMEGPDADRIMQRAVADGAGFVILGSFGYMNGGLQLARRYPDVSILHASGYQTAENFSPFAAKYWEGTYLMGMAAAAVSETGKIGSVSAFAIPELITSLNAFILGAQAINPDVELSVIWTNSWFDPASEREAAQALISQGCDVLFSNAQDTPSVISVAEEEGVYAFNLNSSMKSYAETKYLGVVGTDWAPFFTAQAQAHLDGTFEGANYYLGIEDDTVFVADWSPDIPEDVMAQIEETLASITDGSFSPFAGPLTDQSGEERVAADVVMTDQELQSMDWHVAGVTTPLPE
ncbi:BMP family ABC transporter substrate-binding protein [Pelagovum pacificum]|uniref:BMP family ABC transporter substrate-binding protein n=1 Tax=Pelagovum pacificum TaxID=2588711 RepID=A0A5C5GBB0_9RHOB|nr:BMP family ABC transporter substrate-binding protein [Pelagovum pacificum]QQA42164.1 BMP family ABC transporter substrate-binding protein [Pelagovum pacificum]TNY31250.1 BMP family ABC transporter substrate-binding protein [Pelagovum pacificum]